MSDPRAWDPYLALVLRWASEVLARPKNAAKELPEPDLGVLSQRVLDEAGETRAAAHALFETVHDTRATPEARREAARALFAECGDVVGTCAILAWGACQAIDHPTVCDELPGLWFDVDGSLITEAMALQFLLENEAVQHERDGKCVWLYPDVRGAP